MDFTRMHLFRVNSPIFFNTLVDMDNIEKVHIFFGTYNYSQFTGNTGILI